MRAFVVSINGKQLCTAGIGTNGVLSSSISWSGREEGGHFHMHVGGLDTTSNEHLAWPVKEIGVNDEIITRIIETEEVDAPVSRRTRGEIEAAHKPPGLGQTVSADLMLLDSTAGGWKHQGKKKVSIPPPYR